MKYDDILYSRFLGPAAIISYKNDLISILDINNKYIPELWMNIAKDEYVHADLHKIFDDENMQVFSYAVKKCVTTGEEQEAETWRSVFSNCCGFDRICLKSRFILIEKTDDEAFILESIRNISNEKRTQDTLEDIEHRYKSASEQINIYNWEYTVATKEMRPCYRCMRDLGLPALVTNYPEPAIDMGIFPPDYADMYRDMMRKIDSGVKEIEADIPLTVGRVPFRVKYTTEFDENGNPVKAFGSATLISETELGTIKLDNQIIATLAEEYSCIYMIDFVNDSVKVIKPGEFKTDSDVGIKELITAAASKIQEISDFQKKLLCDVSYVRTDLFKDSDVREFVYKDEKDNRWIRVDYHVIDRGEDHVNRLLITASVVDDFRSQKMDDDKLIATQKAELEDRQKMLVKAIDEANRANRAKTVFFSNMSHDIRTPMSAITGFSRLAIEEINDRAHLEDYLNKIRGAGEHLMSLINDILDMSRIESGKMELSPTPVCVKNLLLECADMIRGQMEENGLKFIVNANELGDDIVECDKLRLRQILLNLLSNAYKFTKKGGSVFLEGKLLDRKDKYTYELRVRDTGIGMSEEFGKHIWEAYSRENTEVVNETQGTGLGMAIVQNIVNLMQGTIELKTGLGKGSEFIIVLPMSPASSDEVDKSEDDNVAEALNKNYEGTTILVVDDAVLNLKLAERVLTKFGFSVKQTNSGVDAVELVKNSKPGDIDLILMDVSMPVMNGLEATKRIRALEDEHLASIPIIAMTANAFESDIKEALDAGMNAHIPKPFLKEDLITKINANLA
ncbi:MAG: response regulator [Lachnospiraceae bacterium]|nr:response regulator [Lachnospiraceae bacterium]